MTDSMGIFQHASLTEPNRSEGYCTDDNARALILAVLLGQLGDAPKRVRSLAPTYAAFLNYAFDPKKGRFHNFFSVARRWMSRERKILMGGRFGRWARRCAALRIGIPKRWRSASLRRRCRR